MRPLILASASPIRAALLRQAGLNIAVHPARLDEGALRDGLLAEGATARDVADALAEHKALRVARGHPGALVLGCDQVLVFQGRILGKPADRSALRARLMQMRDAPHQLLSAAVLYADGEPIWRHVAEATLWMRDFSDGFLDWYLSEITEDILGTVGGYAVEGLGVRLFRKIQGDHFGILGLPLVELLDVLTRRGDIAA